VHFLVEIAVDLPPDLQAEKRADLLAAELQRGRELKADGSIVAIWRIPGSLRNVAIWDRQDATELHDLIASLPLYPYMRVQVTALARHPIDGDREP
jgi:muconolactone D-isomerase